MKKINLLDSSTISKIAAGEVIIRPASVIKELVENSIDAKSTKVIIEIEKGGKKLIRVTDNGIGISYDDIPLAFTRHATSKLLEINDLENISTLGFRGEALASIATVSKINIKTKTKSENSGCLAEFFGEKLVSHEQIPYSKGTSISVEDLFYNTPARLKHLKKDSLESRYISDILEKLALSHPEISFKFINDGRVLFDTRGKGDLKDCLYTIFGSEVVEHLIELNYENSPLIVKGYIGKPSLTRSNRNYQIVFINNRYVKNQMIANTIEEAYKSLIMIHKHPVFFLFIKLPQHMLDVNIHPAKTEIRLLNESLICLLVKQAIKEKLMQVSLIREVKMTNEEPFKYHNIEEAQEEQSTYFENDSPKDIKKYDTTNSITKIKEDVIEVQPLPKNYTEEKDSNIIKIEEKKSNIKNTEEEIKIIETKNVQIEKEYSQSINPLVEELRKSKIIAQILYTYILAENEAGLLLIDQHAAHERIIYEDLMKHYKNNTIQSQMLLKSFPIKLSYRQINILNKYKDMINNFGFDFDFFGKDTIILRSVPILLGVPQNKEFFIDILDKITEMDKVKIIEEKHETIIKSACKKAVKANDPLSIKECESLLDNLLKCEIPYSCPHGRPTIVKITKYELEKMFKRIQ